MTIEELALLNVERTEDTLVVTIEGELDSSNAERVGQRIIASLSDVRTCVVDLSLLTYLDSAALTMLHRLAQLPATLHLVTPPGSRATRLIEIGGLDTVLSTHDTLAAALQGWRGEG